MKKVFLLLLAGLVMAACNTEQLDDIQKQIDELKQNEIASIQQQISNINGSLASLQAIDTELRGYITTLQQQKTALEQADAALGQRITELQSTLEGEIGTAEANVLAQLNAYKQTVAGQIASLTTAIEALQGKDTELQQQITTLKTYVENDLKTYIDNGDNSVKNWASASFATLQQYNTTAGIVATIQGQITTINERLDALESASGTGGVSKQELDDAIAALDASLQGKISQAVTNCNTALATAKDEITAAYTTAIQNAIATSENSMKTWVNTQLTGYYTIAQADAKIATAKTNLEGQLSTQKTQLQTMISNLEATLEQKIKNNADDIEVIKGLIATCNTLIAQNAQAISENAKAISQLQTDLNTARTEITAAYTSAITTAINTLDGKLSGQIATEVATINSRIDTEVATINSTIDALTTRVVNCEKDIKNIKNTIYAMQQDIEDLQDQVAAILARIQSISFVPAYSDGKVPVSYTDNGTLTPGTATFDFKLLPASTAADLAQVWQTALSMQAVYSITKAAPEVVPMTIASVTADSGYLSVVVSGAALSEDFFRSRCRANATLVISDGNNELASEYIPLVPWTTDVISFADAAFKAYLVENFDTSGDGEISEDEALAVTNITASMLDIASLIGIEYFKNLETIDVSFNKLETLDLSHSPKLTSVLVNGNKLQSLNLNGLAAMTELDCSNNKLTELNVSESEGLLALNCSNNQLGALNVKKNKALTDLQCSNNHLTALDVKNNTALETLYCRKNDISVLDVTKLAALKNLDCSNNQLASLNVYGNTLLENLYCANNSLTSLGVSANTALATLDCGGNALTALDVTKNTALQTLSCNNNALTSLDVSRNAALESVDCRGNVAMVKLWVKDAAQESALTIKKEDLTVVAYNDGGINIPDANLKNYLLALFDDDEDGEISIVEAENVQNVNCSGKSISSLVGLENCPNLKYLNFSGNSVSVVELPNLTKLETIVAYGNPIERLNVDNDTALTAFYLQNVDTNALSGHAFRINAYDQAATLYLAFAGTDYTELNLTNSAVLTSYDIAENVQLTKLVASGNSLVTGVNFASLTALTYLDVNACGLTALNVDTNIDLVTLDCSSNALTSLNVDTNVALVTFDCSDNNLSTLRVTNNTALEKLDCSNNALANINVRKNTVLKMLNVSGNTAITALALGYNTILEDLNAANTGLTDIDLTDNLAIKTLNLSGCAGIHIIDLAVNTALVDLNVSSTSLATLDVSNNTSLESLNAASTFLSSLNVSNNTSLATLFYDGCTIDATGLKIGTYVNVANVKGVVFYSSGSTVKIVSADDALKTWGKDGSSWFDATSSTDGMANTNKIVSGSDAAIWCRNKGAKWYLPASDELYEIYRKKASLDATLSSIGGIQLRLNYYWSSTEYNGSYAIRYIFYSGNCISQNSSKTLSSYVRAVRAL